MAAKKKRARTPQRRETLSNQIVVRVAPSMRVRLEKHATRYGLRGVGEAVRSVLADGWDQ
jgi:hypothetical protein